MTLRRILARINREDFVGRDTELREIVRRASYFADAPPLVIQAAPGAGAGECLRQAYDELFMRRGDPVPIYFSFNQGDINPANTARRFFQSLLQQFIAYRRVEPSLCEAPLTFHDLAELALPSDYELVSNLLEGFDRERSNDEDLVPFCFGVPRRLSASGRKLYPLIDCMRVPPFRDEVSVGQRLIEDLGRSGTVLAVAGLRRMVVDLIHGADNGNRDKHDLVHFEQLSESDARHLIETLARRYEIQTTEPTRDLIVQQFNAKPFLIHVFLQAAQEKKTQLTSFLPCQQLYVYELFGGRIKRHFEGILELVAPDPQIRRTLLRVLQESALSEARKSSVWTWKKRLGVATNEFERIIDALHFTELVNSTGALIEVNTESYVWTDFLRANHAMEVANEPRAKVVATMLLETLKRAPQTMARKYRRESSLGLRELLVEFNCQNVPVSLLHYDRFAASYKGEDGDVVDTRLDAESEIIRLPQIVYAAAGGAYSNSLASAGERCAVAHGFDAAEYAEDNEVVWLAAELESKLEASKELAEEWCDRLAALARECGLERTRIWLVAPEGFSQQASDLLNKRGVFSSSRRQVELLTSRVRFQAPKLEAPKTNEFEMVIPMGEDTELIAAQTVEQIARRVHFRPEAINQIKTAVVEACINAAEHSLSPDRKIYQRFVVEDDKLVVTVASRGVVPAHLSGQNGQDAAADSRAGKARRGWGLKLIRTLMDEVEFERVDDGTQLRMTKYIR